MSMNECVGCEGFPCEDVVHSCYLVPDIDIDPDKVSIVMISEAAPPDSNDCYYAGGEALFERTTVLAFTDAGVDVASMKDILGLGAYLATAVKCGKNGYGTKTPTITECSLILGKELALFSKCQDVVADVRRSDEGGQLRRQVGRREAGSPGLLHVQNPRERVHIGGDTCLPLLPAGRPKLLHQEEQTPNDR